MIESAFRLKTTYHTPVAIAADQTIKDKHCIRFPLKIHFTAKSIHSPIQTLNSGVESLPRQQVYKIKHLGIQTASTKICERMGHAQELSEFQRGTVIVLTST